jgi:hypothetical protein
MRSPQKIDPDEWVDAETARAMLGGVAARTLRQMVADCRITRVVRPGPKQTRLYYKPDIERVLAVRPPAVRQKSDGQDALAVLFEILTQMRPKDPARPTLHLSLEEAAAYAGLPAPFLLRLGCPAQARLLEDRGAQRERRGVLLCAR